MFKSYVTTALRKIWREPFYSLLNIVAFSFSMSLSLLILVIVGNQFDYDDFNTNKDRIFRVNTTVEASMGQSQYATSPNSVQDFVDESVVQEWVNLVPASSRFKTHQNDHISINGYYAEGNFFSFFQIPLLTGDPTTILSNPNQIALSKEMSLKLFNSLEVIDQTVDIEGLGSFIVSGVFDMAANKTHLNSDFVLSQTTMRQLVNRKLLDAGLLKPENYAAGYFYIMAKKGASTAALMGTMESLTTSIHSRTIENNQDVKVSFFTQPLGKISPGKDLWLENGRGLSYSAIGIFMLIVCVLLALTCFNYSSMMTSLGLAKSKEIGVRKIIGASTRNIFFQFIAESMIIAFISFAIGLAFFPFVVKFGAFQRLTNDLSFNAEVFIILLLFVLSVGLIAGLLPAMTLSKLKEKDMLSNVFKKDIMKGISFRKIIITLQFSIAMVMVLFAATLIRQTQFMAKGDYGFDYADVISINIRSQNEYTVIKDEFARMPEVLSISSISTNLGYMPTEEFDSWRDNTNKTVALSAYYTDENAIGDLGLSMVSGNGFSSNQPSNANQIVLNEKALELLGLGESALAIGKEIHLNDSARYTVSGVVKDFHFQNFKRSIAPMAFLYSSAPAGILNLKVHPDKKDDVLARLESLPLQREFGSKIDYFFWDQVYRDLQGHDQDILMIVFLTTTLIVIGCLGLIGILAYSVQQRRKEVTLRKIIGANFKQIFLLLTREYILLLLLAVIIGVPIGYFFADQFLREFAYRADLNLVFTLIPIGLLVTIGGAILLFSTIKSCISVPIDSLRD